MGDRHAATGKPSAPSGPATWNQVLRAEVSRLRTSLPDDGTAADFGATAANRASDLRGIYQKIAALGNAPKSETGPSGPLSALCLSGGGIRSATFNLGVLQSLARIGLLGQFDYLSSVSGGGYIAGWLRTWMHREGVANVVNALGSVTQKTDPLAPEPKPVVNLREYSNYLTPKVGLFSGDTWAAAAIILRNLILNWLVLVPLLSAVIGIPLLFLLVVRSTGIPPAWHWKLLTVAVGIELLASLSVYLFRRFAKRAGMPQALFILGCVAPVFLAASALSTAALGLDLPWRDPAPHPCCTDVTGLWEFSAVWCILMPIVGWSVAELLARLFPDWARSAADPDKAGEPDGEPVKSGPVRQVALGYEFAALLVSGSVGMALLVAIVRSWFSFLYNKPALYVVLALPLLLGVYLISRVVFIGMANLSEPTKRRPKPGSSDDADREWWARLSGWILFVLVAWIAITGICLLGSYIPDTVGLLFPAPHSPEPGPRAVSWVKWLVSALGALSGLAAALTGNSAKTPASSSSPTPTAATGAARLLPLAGPIFVLCMIIVLSWGIKAFAQWILDEPRLFGFHLDWNRDSQPLPLMLAVEFLGLL